jgi:hypothetical protein
MFRSPLPVVGGIALKFGKNNMISTADIIDIALWVLGGIVVVYMIVTLRRGTPRSWFFLFAGIILSLLIGYGWLLLSIFVFPPLAGAEMDFSPDAPPLPFLAEISLRQAIPSGVSIALLGTFLTCRRISKNVAEQDADDQTPSAVVD